VLVSWGLGVSVHVQLISATIGALMGLVVGGVLADRATEIAAVLVAWGTLGGLVMAGFAALRKWSITHWTAYGGLFGVGFGVAIVVVDAFFL